jgi:hypothetical protein
MTDVHALAYVRGVNYVAGVLRGQQADPRCRVCKSYRVTAERAKEAARSIPDAPEEFTLAAADAKVFIDTLELVAEPIPQRKVGGCQLPDNKCAVKHAYRFFKDVFGVD